MSNDNTHENPNNSGIYGPRIGLYYGVVIDQDQVTNKIDPVLISLLVEKETGISPSSDEAVWKLDYDHSQVYRTIIIYHTQYSKKTRCPGYIGGWQYCGTPEVVPAEVANMMVNISNAVETLLQAYIKGSSRAWLGTGYSIAYFVE